MLTTTITVNRYQVSGNSYTIGFPYWKKEEIKAKITLSDGSMQDLVLDTDYSVTTPNGNNGTLTKLTAWTGAAKLTIYRESSDTQDLDLIQGGKMNADTQEKGLDHAIAIIQEIQESLSRSLKTSIDEAGSDIVFPDKATRAGMLIGFNNTGEKISLRSLAQFDTDVSNTAANALAAAASALLAQDWADKQTEVVPGEDSAKTWAGRASTSAGSASTSAYNADKSAENAEAWAVGQRDGQDVPATDPTYHKNAKYYAELVSQIISGAMRYQGVWNMTGATDYSGIGTPRLKGDLFYCQGSAVTIDGVLYTQGDLIIFNTDVASGGTITTAVLDKVDNTESLTPDNLAEFSNKAIDKKKNTVTNSPTVISEDITLTPTKELNVVIDTAGVQLTLGNGPYAGYELKVLAAADSSVFCITSGGNLTRRIGAGCWTSFIWDGTCWINRLGEVEGDLELHNEMRMVPKDITAYFNDGSLWDRLHGTNGYALFEDLYVGDYFDMGRAVKSPHPGSGDGTQWVTIAGIDALFNNGYNADNPADYIDYHHLVMVPGKGLDGSLTFGTAYMNSTNVTTGAYYSSYMRSTIIGDPVNTTPGTFGGTINNQLKFIFKDHLKTTRELLATTVVNTYYNRFGTNSGASSAWAWYSCQAVLLSEIEVFGSIAWSSSGFDTGTGNHWLPLFKNSRARNGRVTYWLKDVAGSTHFVASDYGGDSSYYSASGVRGVRPRFVIS